ncbi:MAG TPA: glycosyltransferase [Verrucomicrobiae bacterium]
MLRSYAENYPPTVNQANLLASRGLSVGIVELSAPNIESALNPSIRRWRAHRAWKSKTEPRPSVARRWRNWLDFRQTYHRAIVQHLPRVVLAYDTLACVFAKPQPSLHRTIYHFHELPEPEKKEGFGPQFGRARTAQFGHLADLVTFSDAERARLYKEESKLREMPWTVMNCPLLMEMPPISPLRELLLAQGKSVGKIVCYLGSVGRDQGIIETAASMRHWPPDALFVLIGPYSEQMKALILQATRETSLANRVVFLGAKPHREALALAAGGDLGVSIIQPNTRNWLYSAGAINKRFEYMALGLVQVTNDGPGVAEIIERNQCGLCVNSRDSQAIGLAITRLLSNDQQRNAFASNARQSHLRAYNYETQFANVGDWIEEACRSSSNEN